MELISKNAGVLHLLQWQISDFPGGPGVKPLASSAGDAGLIPGWGAQIPCPSQPKNQSMKQKQYYNKFDKDFKDGRYSVIFSIYSAVLPLGHLPVCCCGLFCFGQAFKV